MNDEVTLWIRENSEALLGYTWGLIAIFVFYLAIKAFLKREEKEIAHDMAYNLRRRKRGARRRRMGLRPRV